MASLVITDECNGPGILWNTKGVDAARVEVDAARSDSTMAETTNAPAPVTPPPGPPQRFSPKKTAATAESVMRRIGRWNMHADLLNVAASDENLVKAVQNAASAGRHYAEAMGCTPPSSKDTDEEPPQPALLWIRRSPTPGWIQIQGAGTPPPTPHPPGTTPPKWLR